MKNFMKNDNGFLLCCPKCESYYTHHEKIEVFNRSEDEKQGLHVVVENDKVLQGNDITDNPSTRRQGILVHFYCEMCKKLSSLSIIQHKGQTLLQVI